MISMENPENPKCNTCKTKWKPDDTDINKNGEVYKCCKDCREYMKEYRKENKDKIKQYNKQYNEENKDKRKQYIEDNKDKIKQYKKEYREDNKEYFKQYREDNKDKIKQYKKEYREDNKDKIKQYNKKNKNKHKQYYENNKCEHNKDKWGCKICNLNLYLVKKQRYNIFRCLKLSSQIKTKSSIDYMGCDADYFIDYFKKKMDLWNENNEIKMNWNNIHLDHIKPVSAFNLDDEDELNKCCNYTNFQPLFSTDNIIKSNKWTDEDEVYWNENIINKEHFGIYMPV